MQRRKIRDNIHWLGAIDWDRRLFDALIPLPDGTSYNAYLIRGSAGIALLDTVDPAMADQLMRQLDGVAAIDYIVCHHAEQDHSGALPMVLERFPQARVLATPKAKALLVDHLHLPEDVFVTVADGETLSLGDKTLRFIHTPWVHWPETMVTYLVEDRLLFSCDFFGAHRATNDLFVGDQGLVHEAAKRYFGEIMQPFRTAIAKNLEKLAGLPIEMIAPSHGQIYDRPSWIIEAYRDWVLGPPRNLVVFPFISMHGSTRLLVDRLTAALTERGVTVELFNLAVTDIGKLAMALVDAATIVVGTPTVLGGPHPLVAHAAFLANALRPKARYLSVVGSYGWGGKAVETLAGMIPNLKVEVLEPVLCKGLPDQAAFTALERLADEIARRHGESGLQ
ncbi:FprA family A-type flavoprotein [Desulfobulbus elongatus]|uniref:FprA family A-type flavoprotein n=1 Tax=Desulfobulbus elongatus TaxID=53332 RepID=UPI000484593A|nr:FprA family A-type flavoprotein [Desulfobulbus elongatus]